jgi:hypothetical protein
VHHQLRLGSLLCTGTKRMLGPARPRK